MTKKQIMIDDVDVAECFHFDKGYKNDNTYCMCDGNMSNICQENPDCYFKQLARKEQECEELKEKYLELKEKYKWYDHYKESALRNKELYNDLSIKYDQLEAENEELKKTVLQKCPQCGEEYLTPKGAELYDENEKLKQASKEIKEIAEKVKGYDALAKLILQKCEVIDDNDNNSSI